MRRGIAGLALLLLGLALVLLPAARASVAAQWHSEQPPGEAGFPALLGEVGDLSCWAADRCALITAGNGGVAAGVFAYDGSGWYRYSTVCGGHQGRIAWAGPDEFWTISDQQAGHAPVVRESEAQNVSLCHFEDGGVVGSYAEPVGQATSYMRMDAAACAGPTDCWFAGERLSGAVNEGAFHLHWDGSALTAVPSPTAFADLGDPGRAVSGLAYEAAAGRFYEGVAVDEADVPSPAEVEAEEAGLGPSLVHELDPGSATPFKPLFGSAPLDPGAAGAVPSELEGFRLSAGEGGLWAAAGARSALSEAAAAVTVLRLAGGAPAQLPLAGPEAEAEVGPGTSVTALAAEPGGEVAWLGLKRHEDPRTLGSPARLALVHADGAVDPETVLPAEGEEAGGEALGRKGIAGPISCPAPEQCWMATEKGWLFHLGSDPGANGDPAMHVLITSRPPDDSLPVLPPLELPEDDSGAGAGPSSSDQEELPSQAEELPRRRPPLVSAIKQKLVDGTVLLMTFTLRTKAHVRLVARRHGAVVAKTKRYTMTKGRRSLRLRLDPKRWPTALQVQAQALPSKSELHQLLLPAGGEVDAVREVSG